MTKEEHRRIAAQRKRRNARLAKQGIVALCVIVVMAVGFVLKGA